MIITLKPIITIIFPNKQQLGPYELGPYGQRSI